MVEEELLWLGERASECDQVVELGSWKGRSAFVLGTYVKGTCICIDTFNGTTGENTVGGPYEEALLENGNAIFRQFMENTCDLQACSKITVMRCCGEDACKLLIGKRFDMIFIDAAHDFDSVVKDITMFKPLVKPGGILCGHDYFHHRMAEAVLAAGIAKDGLVGSIWWKKLL